MLLLVSVPVLCLPYLGFFSHSPFRRCFSGFFRPSSDLDRTFEALATACNPDLPQDLSPPHIKELRAKRDSFRAEHRKLFCTGQDRAVKIERMETESLARAPVRRGPAVRRTVKNPAPRRSTPPVSSAPPVSTSSRGRARTAPRGKSSGSGRKVKSAETVEVSGGSYPSLLILIFSVSWFHPFTSVTILLSDDSGDETRAPSFAPPTRSSILRQELDSSESPPICFRTRGQLANKSPVAAASSVSSSPVVSTSGSSSSSWATSPLQGSIFSPVVTAVAGAGGSCSNTAKTSTVAARISSVPSLGE